MGRKYSIQQIMDECRARVSEGNHVLTLQEVMENAKDDAWPVFVEIHAPGRIGRWTYPREMRRLSKHDKETYNLNWRAWYFPPSDEDRAAHPWERADIIPIQRAGE